MTIGTGLTSASKTIPAALVLVKVLVADFKLFAVCTPLVGDSLNFNQSFAAGFDSLCRSSLGWSVLKGLYRLCFCAGTLRIKRLWLNHNRFGHADLLRSAVNGSNKQSDAR